MIKAVELAIRKYPRFAERRVGYIAGYQQATQDAIEWLKSKGGFTIGFDGATVKDFERAMTE